MTLTHAERDAIAAESAAQMVVKDERILALERQLAARALQPIVQQQLAAPAPPAARTADLRAVRLPEFWPEDPLLWFEQAEAAFESCLVTASRDKYNLVLARLSPTVARNCRSLVIAIRAGRPGDSFEQLRDHLIRCYGRTDWQLGFALMDSPAIGDRRPSDLLQDMRALQPSDGVENTLFKCLFLRRLPAPIRDHLLAVGVLPMDEMAIIADRLHDSAPAATAAFCAVSQDDDELNAVNHGAARSSAGGGRPQGGGNRGAGRGGGGNRGGNRNQPKKRVLCGNHVNFGVDCKKCIPPCDWIDRKSKN
jgi:uncharacterized membrane protein YgcG